MNTKELNMFDETNLRKNHQQMLIISFAMIFSLGIYAGLAEFFLGDIEIFPEGEFTEYSTFRYMIMALSAVIVIVMVIIRNRILAGKIQIPSQLSQSSAEPAQQSDMKKDSPETKVMEFIGRLRLAHIVTYALCESIGIFGLLLFMLGKDKTEFYAFLGVSLFLMLVHFPKYDDWKSRLEDFLGDF
jgi:hypothetical protein